MTIPAYGGCLWPVDPACLTTQWDELAPEVRDRALALASSTLHRLTGGRVGGCPVTVRPCQRLTLGDATLGWWYGTGSFVPINFAGRWVNVCSAAVGCGTSQCEVRLPPPVGRVDQVKVNGAVVTDWTLAPEGRLVWTGTGTCPWPTQQDLSKPDTEPGTFSVTYLNAYPVDSLGAYAAGVLAMEYAQACEGNSCRLPSGVSTVARQGLTMEIQTGAFPNGMTGIREVDAFISLWNPGNLRRAATVWSPDISTMRRAL